MTATRTMSEGLGERRRREVADAARRVIAEKGLEVTTLRDISRKGGFTTGVLMHHFPDKQAVIVGAFQAASEDFLAAARRAAAEAASAGDALEALVRLALPEDPELRREWRLWAEMWAYAGRDRGFADELTATDARWEALLRDVLARAQGEGVLAGGFDPGEQAAVLARLIDGAGLRSWLGGGWEAARRQAALLLGLLGMEPARAERLARPLPGRGAA